MNQVLPLEDIILPAPIGIWPIAYGWWILTFIVLGLIAVGVFKIHQTWQKKRILEAAKKALWQRIETKLSNDLCAAINEWLKIQARPTWPDAMHLYGYVWVAFLNETAQQSLFTQHHAMALAEGPYIPNLWASRVDLHELALKWFELSGAYKTYKRIT